MVICWGLLLSPAWAEESKKEEPAKDTLSALLENLPLDAENKTIQVPLKFILEIALKNNLNLKIEEIRIPVSEQAILEKQSRFDPSIFGEASYGRKVEQTSWVLSGAPVSQRDDQFGKVGIRKNFSTGLEAESYYKVSRYWDNSTFSGLNPQFKNLLILTLRQPLLQDFGPQVNTTDIKVAKNDADIARESFRFQVVNTIDQVEQTYHELSGALETLNLRKESLRLGEELLINNQKRFNAGLTHIGEVQEAETAVASRTEQVIAANQVTRDILNLLKNYLQIQPDSPLYGLRFSTEGLETFPEGIPSYEESFSQALAHRPDYAQKKIALESQNILLKFSRNQLMPRLDLLGTFGLNGLSGEAKPISSFGGGPSAKNPFGGSLSDAWEHMRDKDGYEWTVGLTIDIPLGNRADRARYQQSKLYKEQAIFDLKNLEDTIDLEIKTALENIQSGWERIEVANQFVDLAQKTFEQEEERMKAGLSDTFRILQFQGHLIDAKIRKVQALVECQKALAQLYRAMGTNINRHDMLVNSAVNE